MVKEYCKDQHRYRILLGQNDPSRLTMIKGYLQEYMLDPEIDLAESLDDIIACAEARDFDVILFDTSIAPRRQWPSRCRACSPGNYTGPDAGLQLKLFFPT